MTKLKHRSYFWFRFAVVVFVIQCAAGFVYPQRVAIIAPELDEFGESFVNKLQDDLSRDYKLLDNSLSKAAFLSVSYENAFNLSLDDAKNIGLAIGADFYLLVRTGSTRRYSFSTKEQFESYAVIYVVSSRTGRLIFWKLVNDESHNLADSQKHLLGSISSLTAEIKAKLSEAKSFELGEIAQPKLQLLPDAESPDALNLRPPLPFKRISPKYTEIAYLYGIAATVDLLVDIDQNGKIMSTEISRWAGFGLDESVVRTVAEMNWRPADRNGKPLPMRVLLRYNFRKVEKE